MKFSVVILTIAASMCVANSARILGVFPFPAYSHYQLGDKLLKGLAVRGHEVTVITPYADKTQVKNFKQIVLAEAIEEMEAVKANLFEQPEINTLEKIWWLDNMGLMLTERTLNHTKIKQFLKSGEKFDLVILHQFVNEAYKGFCHHFGASCVVFSPLPTPHWTNNQMGNPGPPSYVPELFVSFSGHMNFFQRLYNSMASLATQLLFQFYTFPKHNELLQKYFPGAPHLQDLYYNTSLMLINSHVSINNPLPYTPNMVEVGGLHINKPKKLPKDLQDYLDNAKDGVVYFSMGSNLKSKDLPKDKRDAILKVFSKLKQKVLWKWEDETLPNQPANVKLSKWLPQQDVLTHPNIKLFITHGGLLSTIEAVYHGVPILGLPVFADQERNIETAKISGYGLAVPYKHFSEEAFASVLTEILTNPKYAQNAKQRSAVMHDQPMKPLDRAIFWVEYVLRHEGAPHLRSAAINLTWYQYLLLDVVAFVLFVISAVLVITVKVTKRLLCRKSVKKVDPRKKKN